MWHNGGLSVRIWVESFTVLSLLRYLIHTLQPVLVPLCFFLTWTFIFLLGWTIWSAIRETVAKAKQMHEIPCANCRFFTNNHHLKCTVQPYIASTEKAIDCPDYRPHLGSF